MCLAVLAAAVCTVTGIYVFNASVAHAVDPQRATLECKREILERRGFDTAQFEKTYHAEKVMIKSSFDGHIIPANYLTIDGSRQRKSVVMTHGLNGNRLTAYPVAAMLLRHGFNVLTYDQRESGENKAPYMTCGYWESRDFRDCVEYVRRCAGKEVAVGGWGSSIGGATVGFYLGTKSAQENLDFAILDCPVSNVRDASAFLTKKADWIPENFKLAMGNLALKLRLGYGYEKGNVCDYVRKTTVPVLIFNSRADRVTPYYMGRDLFRAMEKNQKELVTVDDSGHTDLYLDHPGDYEDAMMEFIEGTEKGGAKNAVVQKGIVFQSSRKAGIGEYYKGCTESGR